MMKTFNKVKLCLMAILTVIMIASLSFALSVSSFKALANTEPLMSITLTDDIVVNFCLPSEGVDESTIKVNYLGKDYEVDAVQEGANYVIAFDKVTPQYLTETLTLKYTQGGQESTLSSSVKDYLLSLLEFTPEQLGISCAKYEKLEVLVANTLEYGAAAQTYTETNVDELATDGTETVAVDYSENAVSVFSKTNGQVIFKGANLSFDYKVGLLVDFALNDVQANDVKCIFDVEGTKFTVVPTFDGTKYSALMTDLCAVDFDKTITITVQNGEEELTGSAVYSVASYVDKTVANANASANIKALSKAVYSYGYAAKAYKQDNSVGHDYSMWQEDGSNYVKTCSCGDVKTNGVAHTFSAVSPKTELTGSGVKGDVHIAQVLDSTVLTYRLAAEEAHTATFVFVAGTSGGKELTGNYEFIVNGQVLNTTETIEGIGWTNYENLYISNVNLVVGENVITFKSHLAFGLNIKEIKLINEGEIIDWYHDGCQSECSVCGKCQNDECTLSDCKEKCRCVSSTINCMDVDAEIIIKSGTLNPTKGQIGGTSSKTLLTFNVMVDKAGDYAIFANIGSSGSKTVASRLAITANGTALTMSTDSYGLGYEVYQDVYLATATLVEGENVIVWDYLDDAINFRSMTLIGVGNVQWNHSCASACSVCGGCGDENCTSQICATKCKCLVSTLSVTATGTTVGFVGGGTLNYSAGRTGGTAKGTVVLVNVWADKADNAVLTIPVSQGSGSAVNSLDSFSVKVNGVNHSIPADSNVSVVSNWNAWTDVSFGALALEEGLNTIEFTLLNTGFNFQKFVFNAIGGAEITYPTSNMMVSADDANYAITGSGSYNATNLRIEQTNTGTQVAFNVTSDKQGQVDLYLIIGKAVNSVAFGSCLAVDVNGVEFDTTGVAFSSGANAYTWIKVGTITLNEGANTITFKNLDGYVNYYGISLVGAGVNVSWTAK